MCDLMEFSDHPPLPPSNTHTHTHALDQLGKCSVILVAVLAISNAKDKGLRLKDSTGEIHCEVSCIHMT